MAGYVTAVLDFVCSDLPALQEASNFCDLKKKITLVISLLFYSSKRLLFEMSLIRISIPNLCPIIIMIHFNALDFSECRSKK